MEAAALFLLAVPAALLLLALAALVVVGAVRLREDGAIDRAIKARILLNAIEAGAAERDYERRLSDLAAFRHMPGDDGVN